jgi:hypothetical protein
VVTDSAPVLALRDASSAPLGSCPFGTGIDVIRFQQGWAECRMGHRIGWVEMRNLGTEADMKRKAPIMSSPAPRPKEIPVRVGEDEP